jgi:hypothetical protein
LKIIWIQVKHGFIVLNDGTLPNFIKRKHPRNEEKKKQRAKTKVQASKQPKRGVSQGGKGTTKHQNLHQSQEAYKLKKGEVSLITLQA